LLESPDERKLLQSDQLGDHGGPTLVTGADIRRYRRAIGWNQTAFAERLGIGQSTLSVIEAGRISVSDDHVAGLVERFSGIEFKPTFPEFVQSLEQERAQAEAALSTPQGRFTTLTVWTWDGFELGRQPAPDQAVGLVTIRATEGPAIALEMHKATHAWAKGEILVFEKCSPVDVTDGDLCLLQVKRPRARAAQTLIATARVSRPASELAVQFEPVAPPAPRFSAADTAPATILRLIFRGSYTRRD
jgi:transcriptional regulator with XRE-family HTH domain